MSLCNRIAALALDALFRAVPWYAARDLDKYPDKPCVWGYTIEDDDGSPYLSRVLFPRIPASVPWVGGMRPMLHKFHRPDRDKALHNHPWSWARSLLLAGEYDEERLLKDESTLAGKPVTETRRVRWFNVLDDTDFHRVTELHGIVYTLFCIGPRKQSWGFMDERTGRVADWKKYLAVRKVWDEPLADASGFNLDVIGAVLSPLCSNVDTARRGYPDTWLEPDDEYRQRLETAFYDPVE